MTKIKQKYIKPEVKVYQIDSDISLQMTSENDPPTDPWGKGSQNGGSQEGRSNSQNATNPFEQNPFGE